MRGTGPKTLSLVLAVAALLAFAYYFFGTSERYLTRNYFLEKKLRNLVFLETHEPVDYADVLNQYQRILKGIRFGNDTNRAAAYHKAVSRTMVSTQLVSCLREFKASKRLEDLETAHRLYGRVINGGLTEHDFYSVYFEDTFLSEQWFREELVKARAMAGSPK